MISEHDDIDIPLARYFAGRLSREERLALEQQLEADPARCEEVEQLRVIWEASEEVLVPSDAGEPDVARALHRLKAARARRSKQPALTIPRARRSSRTTRLLRIAATITVLLAGGLLWRTADRARDGSRAVAMVEHRTERGQRGELRLADGTQIIMNVDSRIRVAADYGRNTRDVYVEGEALFDVAHDERRPFRVHAGGAVAEDLGTRFSVRSYTGDTAVVVVVAEGRVELKSTSESAVLEPNQLGSTDAAGAVRVLRDVDADALLGWSEGRLQFTDATLRDVVVQLSRWYDIDVRLGDPALEDLRLTATIDNERVTQVIELIALSFDLRYERSESGVTFYPQRNAR